MVSTVEMAYLRVPGTPNEPLILFSDSSSVSERASGERGLLFDLLSFACCVRTNCIFSSASDNTLYRGSAAVVSLSSGPARRYFIHRRSRSAALRVPCFPVLSATSPGSWPRFLLAALHSVAERSL